MRVLMMTCPVVVIIQKGATTRNCSKAVATRIDPTPQIDSAKDYTRKQTAAPEVVMKRAA